MVIFAVKQHCDFCCKISLKPRHPRPEIGPFARFFTFGTFGFCVRIRKLIKNYYFDYVARDLRNTY